MNAADISGMQIKTMGGTEHSSVYAIIAQKNGLSLGFRGDISANPFAGVVMLFCRVRCQKAEDWANLDDGPSLFNMPALKSKGSNHSSFEQTIIIAKMPVTPYKVTQIVEKEKLIDKMVESIVTQLPKDLPLELTKEQMTMYLSNALANKLPEVDTPQLTEFPIYVGKDALNDAFNSMEKNAPVGTEPGGEDFEG